MSVKDRLKRLTGEAPAPEKDISNREILTELRRKIDALMEPRERMERRPAAAYREPPPSLEDLITGEEVENGCGRFYFSRNVFRGTLAHGNYRIDTLAQTDMDAAALLAGNTELAGMTMTDALFLDTETTGLAGGTGTVAFLIGLGWFEGDDFIVCQLFARDFSEEAAMLAFLREIALEKRFLVTFNGRAYDMNLLASRFILNRMSDPFTGLAHLDLLHPSRRLLGHRLENSRLVTLEACVLGVERHGDVPGYEIPQRYFDWLRSRDARLMEDVFEHNRLDIISMAALVKHLAGILDAGGATMSVHPADLLAAARLHQERGNTGTARHFLGCVLESENRLIARDARMALSLMHKRSGLWEEAVKLWEDMAQEDPCDLFAVEELAKFLEHRAHDYLRAIELVDRVLSRPLAQRDALEYRLRRLRGKAGPPEQG